MEALTNIFTKTKMSWVRVIVLAIVCGVVPGLLMIPKALDGTSFRQPGITYEFWLFCGLFISLNCRKPLEAGCKVFVFFLISQPLIYLVQVPFASLGWGLFRYYRLWFMITFATFPAAMLAWYTKKGNWLGVLILSIGNFILCFELPDFVISCVANFPHLILAILFIIAEIVIFILMLFKSKAQRIIAFLLVLVMLAATSWYTYNTKGPGALMKVGTILEGTQPYEITYISEGADFTAEIKDNMLSLMAKEKTYGSFEITVKDSTGKTYTYIYTNSEEGVEFQLEE